MAYATVSDVRAKLNDSGVTDESTKAALELAGSLIDFRFHGVFQTRSSQMIYDVRGESVVFDHPGTITRVLVDGTELPQDAYGVTPWG